MRCSRTPAGEPAADTIDRGSMEGTSGIRYQGGGVGGPCVQRLVRGGRGERSGQSLAVRCARGARCISGPRPGEGRSSPVTSQGWDEDDLLEQLGTAGRWAGGAAPAEVARGGGGL